jgi:hypothetical protein
VLKSARKSLKCDTLCDTLFVFSSKKAFKAILKAIF